MRMHQGSAPSSCAPSSSSTFCFSSSRVPRSSALRSLLPISSSPTSAHYVTLPSTVHICPRGTRVTTTWSWPVAGGWLNRGCGREEEAQGMRERKSVAKRDEETMYRPAIRESQRGPHSVRLQRPTSIGRLPSESFYPGRGADGCRATAVRGAFGRAYFPAMPAPTTVPRSIDRCHHRRRRQRGRRRGWRVVRGEPRKLWSPYVPSSSKAPLHYPGAQFIAVSVLLDGTLFNNLYIYNCRASHEYAVSKLSFSPYEPVFFFVQNNLPFFFQEIFFKNILLKIFFNRGRKGEKYESWDVVMWRHNVLELFREIYTNFKYSMDYCNLHLYR